MFLGIMSLINSHADKKLIEIIINNWYFLGLLFIKNISLSFDKQNLYDYTYVLFMRLFAVMIILIIFGKIIGLVLNTVEISDLIGIIIVYFVVGIIFLMNFYFDYLLIKSIMKSKTKKQEVI